MPLPTQKTPKKSALSDVTVLLYGKTKLGKSTLCSHAEGALFLATESGLNHLEVYQSPIATWDEMLAACSEIAAGQHPFKTIIIDTVDNAYRMCVEHVCRKFKVEHESDLGYGKGYALINNEFYRVLNKLALLPYGLFLISHAQEKEYETPRGKVMRTVPTIPDKARKIVLGMVDLVLYADVEAVAGENGVTSFRRVIRTKPSPHYEAGDRTGRMPEVLDLDYATFLAAFEEARGQQAKALTAPLGPPPATPGTPASPASPNAPPAPQPTAPAKPAAPPPATAPAQRPAPAAAPK
ncbi:MAG: ATP-binding protein [Candidatus Sumerlaeia bacterium]|nr:ATP-binding protein [Candidatus Sumerlaeia bacterium]